MPDDNGLQDDIIGQEAVRHHQLHLAGIGKRIGLVPEETLSDRYLRLRDGLLHTVYRKGVTALVTLEVAQDILQLIIALFVEVDDTAKAVGRKDRELVARLNIGFHIPTTGLSPMVVVAPGIHEGISVDGNTVDV